jgi:hypothetical protein
MPDGFLGYAAFVPLIGEIYKKSIDPIYKNNVFKVLDATASLCWNDPEVPNSGFSFPQGGAFFQAA